MKRNKMNKLIIGLTGIMSLGTLASCSNDDSDYSYEVNNFRAEAREGAIMLRWDVPADSNYLYVETSFYNIRQKKENVMNTSVHVDSLLIDGLLARDGEYNFRLTAVSNDGTKSNLCSQVSCTALPVKPVITVKEKELDIELVDFSTNAQEPSEGPLENLFDGNPGTFFHTPWSVEKPYPQWVDMEFSAPYTTFRLTTINRGKGNGSGCPGEVTLEGSNDKQNWEVFYEFNGVDVMVNAPGGKWESPVINTKDGKAYKYLRFNAHSGNGGNKYWNMAEMSYTFLEVTETVYDPENEAY